MIQWKKTLPILLAVLIFGMSGAWADQVVVLQCWTYYNGVQEKVFSAMVDEFNDTVGKEQGVFVEYSSKSSIGELDKQVRASAMSDPGAEPMPDLFGSYADTAYALQQLGVVADLSPYLTQEDQAGFIDAYIQEGRLGGDAGLYIFPTAKSTEMLLLNQTAWDQFAKSTGAQESELATWEGIVRLAKDYYEWTDSLTPDVPGDGRAFFGRDAMANYLLVGARQLGSQIFDVVDNEVVLQLDEQVMRRLWDCFYVPYMNGWFTAEGRYRSDDIKTGRLIALVGSTSGAMYFPDEVTADDGTSEAIECSVHHLPNFEGASPCAVQQGAGIVVSKSTPEREAAAVAFLRWFVQPERNIEFSMGSGYLPVTKAANEEELLMTVMDRLEAKPIVKSIIGTGAYIATNYEMYTSKPFANGYEARQVLEETLLKAAQDAQAKRIELIAGGMSPEEAGAQLDTDEAFEKWYETTMNDLKNVLKNER